MYSVCPIVSTSRRKILSPGFLSVAFYLCNLLLINIFLMAAANTAYAARVTTSPYFVYGAGSAGEAFSLGEWISQKNQYYQAAFDTCIATYNAAGGSWPDYGAKVCILKQVSGVYTYPNASTYSGVQNPQGITVTETKNNVTTTLQTKIPVAARCSGGYSGPMATVNNTYECVKDEPQSCESDGDPINILTGEKFEYEVDYSSVDGLLKLERFYQDQYSGWTMATPEHLFYLSQNNNSSSCLAPVAHKTYRYTFQNPDDINEMEAYVYSSCVANTDPSTVYIRIGRQKHYFKQVGDVFVGQGRLGLKLVLEKANPAANQGVAWIFSNAVGDRSYFGEDGTLLRKVFVNGGELNYQYTDSTLTGVMDNKGRSLAYSYDARGRLAQVLLPDNNTVTYEYETDDGTVADSLIEKVVWSNGESVTYLYNEEEHKDSNSTSQLLLTGKLDALEQRIDITKYQSNKAIYNEIALGVQPRTFLKNNASVQVTDGLGSQRNYIYSSATSGLLVRTNQPAGSGCAASTKEATYYDNGLKKSQTNFNGHKTQFNYDMGRALETVRVEGIVKTNTTNYLPANTPLAAGVKKTTTQWHSQHRKPAKKSEPKLITTFIYNGDADPFNNNQIAHCAPLTAPVLCHKVQQATVDVNGATGLDAVLDPAVPVREAFYSYNGFGQQLTYSRTGINSPEEVREYYETTTSEWTKGDLKRITNALGHSTEFTRYDLNGRLLAMQDANGVETLFTYDVRGRVTSQSVAGAITAHTYDLNGNRIKSVLPNGVTVNYEYDAAKRLIAVTDAHGDKINYEYDVENNLRFERITTGGGATVYAKQHVYDALSRVKNTLDSSDQGSTYLYDANGNLTGEVDAKTQTTNNTFDPLDRLTRTTDALAGKIDYSYDAQGNLTQVKDPKSNSTTYSYNAFGDLISQTSPDTGTTIFAYDALGNRTRSTDARGVVTNYSYDALDRLISVQYPAASSDNVTYHYDANANGNYGIGRLTSVVTSATRLDFEYNDQGLIAKKYAQAGDTFASTQYSYDAAGTLVGMVYPSGRIVNYQLDSTGKISGISTKASANAAPQSLISNVSYLPFGPAQSYSYGNGLNHTQTYDQDYRLTSIQVGGILNRNYGYDLVNNITSINNGVSAAHNQAFSYDALNRLVAATGSYGSLGYSYDAVGNRLTETRNGTTDTYSYPATSNRLTSIAHSTGTRDFTYDAAGNRIQDNGAASVPFALTVQAEHYSSMSGVGTETTNDVGGGLDVGWIGNNDSMSYSNITIPTSGTYTITYRIASLNGGGSLVLEGIGSGTVYDTATIPATGGWQVWQSVQRTVTLPAGTHNFKLKAAVGGFNLNWFKVEAVSSTSTALMIQAESYSSMSGVGTEATSDVGGGLSVGWIGNNDYMSYSNITIPTSGTYTITYRIASPNGGGSLKLEESGSTTVFDTAIIPATGSWQTWQSVQRTVSFPAGNHQFTLKAVGGGFNINWFKIEAQTGANANTSTQNYSYNQANRLSSVDVNNSLAARYTYNPFGQRMVKTLPNNTKEIYHYDEAGQLIVVTDGAGTPLREYIYWNTQQIALINNGTLYFIHSDHLNTPQVVTAANQQVVWMGDYEPFGKLAQNQNNSIELYSRFPGQYLDRETGLYYNYFRDYDASIGRYIESDPIGLEGGINTYAYVGGNPLVNVDPTGLFQVHGNWCGPDWTGGQIGSYSPHRASSYKEPIDNVDQSCKAHDICYYECRQDNPCDKSARGQCFLRCDSVLSADAWDSGGISGTAVGTAMDRPGSREEPNDVLCGCPQDHPLHDEKF